MGIERVDTERQNRVGQMLKEQKEKISPDKMDNGDQIGQNHKDEGGKCDTKGGEEGEK